MPAPRSPFLLLAALLASALPAAAIAGYAVDVVPARMGAWQAQVDTLGEARSLAYATLRAPLAGQLRGPYAAQGAQVARGRLLARVVPPGLRARIAAAQHRLDLDRKLLQHVRTLYHGRLATVAEVQQAQTQAATAQDQLDALRAERRATRLTAPAAGTVNYLLPPGTRVTSGTAVARLAGAGGVWVRSYVTPTTARALHPGAPARLAGDGWQGAARIASVGDDARHDGLVEVVLRPAHGGLMPGEWLHVRLPGVGGHAWQLPTQALVMRGARALVYTVAHGRAHAVPVKLAHLGQHAVWVEGPLHAGEPVVTRGAGTIADGTPVDVRAPGA
ncbi:efflux RND transporter periplasmic adaptor subunit [Acidihalobacter prosperus]|uniref:YknX-like C-terminal permuted SH3-like domain-containing protein n=1 Tax=Acidihalobacter prosperus TaxID=160660 RepID=A0A1A6C3R9_9GAMM|nr:efflux RND transporter periplasmic adaptor subunit [Acidihalobacter prosperus]OBS09190.1 hypothetical protein Thpro_021518 [Acidihalobacter prosperus]